MPDFRAAYTETRDRLIELVRSLSDTQLATTVPACSAWTAFEPRLQAVPAELSRLG